MEKIHIKSGMGHLPPQTHLATSKHVCVAAGHVYGQQHSTWVRAEGESLPATVSVTRHLAASTGALSQLSPHTTDVGGTKYTCGHHFQVIPVGMVERGLRWRRD